jgi:hypothetical protein
MYRFFSSLIILLALLAVSVSCGKDYYYYDSGSSNNSNEGSVDGTEVPLQTLAGLYVFKDGALIEVLERDGKLEIRQSGSVLFVSKNKFNGTFGELPRLSTITAEESSIVTVTDENSGSTKYVVLSSRNYNFTSGHDVENDSNGNNITGSKRVDVTVTFLADGRLRLKYKIYNAAMGSNLNSVVAVRSEVSY